MPTCLKDYSIEVTSPAVVQLYWKLDSAMAAANTDSVTGNVLTLNNFGAIVSGVPAKISNGLQITGGAFCTCFEVTQNALYLGTGWSLAGWARWSSAGTGNEGMQWIFCSAPSQNFTWIIGTGEYHFPYDGVSELTGNTPLLPADAFHFVAFRYDPATGKLGYSFNGAAFVDLPGNAGVMLVNPEPSPYFLVGNEEVIWDEIGAFAFPMTDADVAYLFNAGSGRTYPFTFPP